LKVLVAERYAADTVNRKTVKYDAIELNKVSVIYGYLYGTCCLLTTEVYCQWKEEFNTKDISQEWIRH
jgi:hypothetical protein